MKIKACFIEFFFSNYSLSSSPKVEYIFLVHWHKAMPFALAKGMWAKVMMCLFQAEALKKYSKFLPSLWFCLLPWEEHACYSWSWILKGKVQGTDMNLTFNLKQSKPSRPAVLWARNEFTYSLERNAMSTCYVCCYKPLGLGIDFCSVIAITVD